MTNAIRVNEYVTDTMGLVLRIEKRKLTRTARSIFDAAESGQATLYIPALVFAEILYLSEKGRIGSSIMTLETISNSFPIAMNTPSVLPLCSQPLKSPTSQNCTTD
jgi:predicted nucleic acid-binding protein